MAISPFKKKPDTFDYDVSRVCKACGTMFHGRFCNRCGEKVFEPHERSILHFLDSLLNAFTFLDGKFIKSLKLLVIRPGELSRNISEGVRTPYMKMVSLFFVANFFYFLLPTWDSFNSSLNTQMNSLNYFGHSARVTQMVNERIEKDQITLEQFGEKYRAQSTNLSKLLLIVLAMMFTLVLMVVCFSRRKYFFDHLLFSMEFFSFHIILNLLVLTYLFFGLIVLFRSMGVDVRFIIQDSFFSLIVYATIGYFLFRGLIIFYDEKWYWALIKIVILINIFRWVVDFYRIMLFYFTMWTM